MVTFAGRQTDLDRLTGQLESVTGSAGGSAVILSVPGGDLVRGLAAADWNQALRTLAAALPDQRPTKRYRVADQYLRFWLAFLRRGVAESERFGARDLEQLVRSRPAVPGAGDRTRMVAVSQAGFEPDQPLDDRWEPDDLLRSWAPGPARQAG
jgi:hypothetical protein